MNKQDFIRYFAKKGYKIKDSEVIVNDFLDSIEELMVNGETIAFHGFGTFGSIERKEHESTNVKTHERIVIPSFRSPKFEAGKALKRSVREGIIRK